MAGFVEVIKRNVAQLGDLEGEHADEFARLLKALKDALTGRLADIAPSDSVIDAIHLRAALGESEILITALEKKALGQYDAAAKQAVDMSIEHMTGELDALSSRFGTELPDVSFSAGKILADPMQGLLADHFESSVERYGSDLLNGVRQRLFVGFRAGDTVGDIAKDLRSSAGPFGQSAEANADRLVRTEVSQAYNSAHASGFKQAKEAIPQLREVWIHLGSFPCEICGPLHGTERPKSGYWTIKQGARTRKVVHPPAHPNCTCRLVAMTPSWRGALEDKGYLESQDGEDRPEL